MYLSLIEIFKVGHSFYFLIDRGPTIASDSPVWFQNKIMYHFMRGVGNLVYNDR